VLDVTKKALSIGHSRVRISDTFEILDILIWENFKVGKNRCGIAHSIGNLILNHLNFIVGSKNIREQSLELK